METITGVNGQQFHPKSKDYETRKYQYASSSYEKTEPTRIDPALIIYPQTKEEIAKVLQYARSKKVAVAIRTGGHQYSGASSTSAPNIQIDVGKTFRGPNDLQYFEKDGEAFVYASVSWPLEKFSDFLKKHKAFVPHGQCVNVHLGGHVQTGGYGQLARSFGLLGDHVISLDIIDYEGKNREVTKKSDPDLFFAILGGSPGNFGVITHFTIKVHQDKNYIGSRGVKSIYWYDTKTLTRLLNILVEMAENENLPRNYDFTVNVLSSSNKLLDLFPDIDGRMRDQHPELYGDDDLPFWPRMIIVFAQWVPFSRDDKPDMAWFDRVREGSIFHLPVIQKPMSLLSADWLFQNVREFDHPYVKSTRCTNSRTLSTDGWAEWITRRIDALVEPQANRCWLSAQLQVYGGKNSMFVRNAENGTGYSWRKDTTICCTLDAFYGERHRTIAEDWQKVNAVEGVGADGKFCKTDRRVLWGSFGGFDLDANWAAYHESREKYERIGRVRQRMDPEGTLTPNTFAVKRVLVGT